MNVQVNEWINGTVLIPNVAFLHGVLFNRSVFNMSKDDQNSLVVL